MRCAPCSGTGGDDKGGHCGDCGGTGSYFSNSPEPILNPNQLPLPGMAAKRKPKPSPKNK